MKALIACEFSGVVRDQFTSQGFDATSCDLLPSETPGKHYHGAIYYKRRERPSITSVTLLYCYLIEPVYTLTYTLILTYYLLIVYLL